MVQGWYQGGISVFDWTDSAKPKEIAYFDRGPVDATRIVMGGSWSVYWYNGLIVSSEIARGLDIYELLPSGLISQNELDAAKTVRVRLPERAGAAQVRLAAELREGARLSSISSSATTASRRERISAVRADLAGAEKLSGGARQQALRKLATQLNADAAKSTERAKVRMLSTAVTELVSVR